MAQDAAPARLMHLPSRDDLVNRARELVPIPAEPDASDRDLPAGCPRRRPWTSGTRV